ncbi:TetR/AcrR family transcriptional regulator [Clostridium estertheticum]|uniref:TetR/AcrR family transcriptional regulator n=1 Tax=Clostridium estertheticum TaxID=238834 RepID=UPI001C6DF0B3|nr:TetR/AcrR family transcriptional regulator [Clostridium estertheticum]MBW9174031.1 TetR/AcrR family transcriptional regulator [Clostridium estertheticum]WLC77616.1 TetR/AcrR family transcriptional regulator [Clostridium estertheticum]
MEKKQTTRQLQAIEARHRIREKALELFKTTDYEDVSIADICKYADMSVGNFYNYFISKEELIMEFYPLFDSYVETEFACNKYVSNMEAIKYLIFKQINGAESYGPKIFAQMLRIQIKTNGKHVIEDTRIFHTCLKNLVQNALNDGELEANYSAFEISSLILRISRGTLLDWAMSEAPYCASERVLHDIDMLLSSIIRK